MFKKHNFWIVLLYNIFLEASSCVAASPFQKTSHRTLLWRPSAQDQFTNWMKHIRRFPSDKSGNAPERNATMVVNQLMSWDDKPPGNFRSVVGRPPGWPLVLPVIQTTLPGRSAGCLPSVRDILHERFRRSVPCLRGNGKYDKPNMNNNDVVLELL